jgi:uncharacterized protein YqeY
MEGNIIAGRIQGDLKEAVRRRDRVVIGALRMMLNALKNAELDEREELSEDQEIAVISSYARKCRESIAEFERGGRDDLVVAEKAELDVVMRYLPKQMNEDEIRRTANEVIGELGASGPRDVGRVMGEVMKRIRGRADGGMVRTIVQTLLGGE